jgi:hypothetical protein
MIYVDSRRVRTVNGVETDTQEYVGWTFSESLLWVSGVMEGSGSYANRLRVTVTGGYQSGKSGTITFQQTGTSNTFSVPVSLASRYILRYSGLFYSQGVGLFNTYSAPVGGIYYPFMPIDSYNGVLAIYGDEGIPISDVATGNRITAYIGDIIYARARENNSWGPAVQVTLGIDTMVPF